MTTRLILFVVLSIFISFGSSAHDSDRLDQLEKELDSAIKRIETLEAMLQHNN